MAKINALEPIEPRYVIKGSTLQSIADAIRSKTGKTDPIAVEDFDTSIEKVYESGEAHGYNDGYDQGKQAEYDAFWDAFQENGSRTTYQGCFGAAWTKETLKPKYPISAHHSQYMFYKNQMGGDLVEHFESIDKVLDFDGQLSRNINRNLTSTFESSLFTRVGKIYSTSSNWERTFYNCNKLVTIDEVGNPKENGDAKFQIDTFTYCKSLENITIVGWIVNSIEFGSSTKLSRASIESIINHLSGTASEKTLTLSKTAVDTAFSGGVSGSDFSTPTGVGSDTVDWHNLLSSKSNWSITLV